MNIEVNTLQRRKITNSNINHKNTHRKQKDRAKRVTPLKRACLKMVGSRAEGFQNAITATKSLFCENFALLQNFLSAVAWGWGGVVDRARAGGACSL